MIGRASDASTDEFLRHDADRPRPESLLARHGPAGPVPAGQFPFAGDARRADPVDLHCSEHLDADFPGRAHPNARRLPLRHLLLPRLWPPAAASRIGHPLACLQLHRCLHSGYRYEYTVQYSGDKHAGFLENKSQLTNEIYKIKICDYLEKRYPA